MKASSSVLYVLLIVSALLFSCRKWENVCDENVTVNLTIAPISDAYALSNINISVSSDFDSNFPVKLELYNNATFIQTITDSALANVTYQWFVTEGLSVHSNYRIKASLPCRPDIYSYSNDFEYHNLKDYNCVQSEDLSSFFMEDFSSNTHNWYTGTTGNLTATISSDLYTIVNNNSTSQKIWLISPFDGNQNFQFETLIKYSSSTSVNYIGFLWGYFSSIDYYGFFFENSQYYEFEKSTSDIITPIINKSYSSSINSSNFNKITVRKINNKYYFFINESFVASTPFTSFFENANKIAFYFCPNSNNQIDYFRIFYIY